jgi:cell division protein FtsB
MKRVAVIIVIFICLFIIQGLVRSIWTLWEKKDVLREKQEELVRAKREYASLKEKEKEVTNPQFAEAQIRDKLFLVKPNEKIVLLPSGMPSEKKKKEAAPVIAVPIYLQWFRLFQTGRMPQG